MSLRCAVLAVVAFAVATPAVQAAPCDFVVDKITQVSAAGGKSQTARGNERCIAVDAAGTAHMVWTDDRDGNVEIYYATLAAGKIDRETRLTNSTGESSFPCVAVQGGNVHILWQEMAGKVFQIWYLRLAGGKEAARKQLTSSLLDATCPVSAVGPDGTLHIAWHEGAGSLTSIRYGKVVGDALIGAAVICGQHASAFRPDIAVNEIGQVLLAWYEGFDIKSTLWDGKAWGEETLATTNHNREWRLSVAPMSAGKWALVWYDQAPKSTDVLAAFYDGKTWHGQVRLNSGVTGFYPAITQVEGDRLVATWEDQDRPSGKYLLLAASYNGRAWSEPAEIARSEAMSRYSSLAVHGGAVHAVWFSPKTGNDEIFHGLLRRR